MALTVTTDHRQIADVLDRFLRTDPVRATILGTIRTTLEPAAWLAVDGDSVAVRSGEAYPLLVLGPWPGDRLLLSEALRSLPSLRGLSGPEAVVRDIARLLGYPVTMTRAQRLFRCDDLVPPGGGAGRARPVDPGVDADLVRHWFAAFMAEIGEGFGNARQSADRALVEGGGWLWCTSGREPATVPTAVPVSLAVRRPVTAGSARIGPVYTPPEHRGHGYGSAVTAAATADVLGDGGLPVLFTDLANPTSNKIYQQLGYRPVDDRLVLGFE